LCVPGKKRKKNTKLISILDEPEIHTNDRENSLSAFNKERGNKRKAGASSRPQ
jgi:hypothetical protein